MNANDTFVRGINDFFHRARERLLATNLWNRSPSNVTDNLQIATPAECGQGFYWSSAARVCVKDSSRAIFPSHPSHDASRAFISDYGHLVYPLSVFLLAVCVASILIILRFYIEYLIYLLSRRIRRQAAEQGHESAVRSLRTGFRSPSITSLPPPYPGHELRPGTSLASLVIKPNEPPPSYDEAARHQSSV